MKNSLLLLCLVLSGPIFSQAPSKQLLKAFNNDDSKALFSAINTNNLDVCYDINESSYGLLAIATKFGAIECFTQLVEKGANLKKICTSKTPLLYAVKYGQLDMVKLLIAKGVNHKATGSNGKNAIDYAQRYEQKKILTYLESL